MTHRLSFLAGGNSLSNDVAQGLIGKPKSLKFDFPSPVDMGYINFSIVFFYGSLNHV